MDSLIANPIRFWLFMTALIPSIVCSIQILYHILSSRTRRHAIHNHVILILLFNNLIYEFTNIPFFLNYFRLNKVLPPSARLCLIWMFIDEGLFTVSTVTVAWASIERHLLIFHRQWLSTNRGRILFHYIPLTVIICYALLFHFIAIIFPPCENSYDYTLELCGHPMCFHNTRLVGTWDSLANDIIPATIIVVFSMALLVRVLIKNHRIRRSVQWRKHKKMAIQLLAISALYFVLYIPSAFVELIQLCCLSDETIDYISEYAKFCSYYVIFLLPYVYLISLVENRRQLKSLLPCWYRSMRLIGPTTLATINLAGNTVCDTRTMVHN